MLGNNVMVNLSILAVSCGGGAYRPFAASSSKSVVPVVTISHFGVNTGTILTSLTSSGLDDNEFLRIDREHHRVMRFSGTPLELLETRSYPEKLGDVRVLPDGEEQFWVVLGNGEMYLSRPNQEMTPIAIGFQGNIEDAIYDGARHLLVAYDDLGSIGIVRFNDDGSINEKWLGGPLIDSDIDPTSIEQFAYVAGRVFVVMGDRTMRLIDHEATLAEQEWVTEAFPETFSQRAKRVFAIDDSEFCIVTLASEQLVVDSRSGQVIDRFATSSASQVYFSRLGTPHFLIGPTGSTGSNEGNSSGLLTLRIVDDQGKFSDRSIFIDTGRTVPGLASDSSWYDGKGKQLTIGVGTSESLSSPSGGTEYTFVQMRLSDSLVMARRTFSATGDVGMLPDRVIEFFGSELGLVKSYSYDRNQTDADEAYHGYNYSEL